MDGNEQCDGMDFGHKTCADYGFYTGTLSCTNACMANLGQCAGRCGDQTIQAGVQCDGTNLNGATCTSLGYKGQTQPLTCTNGCTYAASSCTCGGVLCAKNTQTCVVTGGIAQCQ